MPAHVRKASRKAHLKARANTHGWWLAALVGLALLVAGCEERERQDREYRSDPTELLQALRSAHSRPELLEVLDLIAAAQDTNAEKHPEIVAEVSTLLEADDPMLASKAGDVLARWGDSAAAEPLIRLLRHPNPWVRVSAGSSLAILEDPSVVDKVAEATLDPDENVRAQACRTLAEIRQPLTGRSLNLVRERLADGHPSVRAAAATALGRVGSEADFPHLRAAVDDPNTGVVVAAIRALGRLGDRDSVPVMIGMLESPEQARAVAAAAALGKIRDPRSVDALAAGLRHPDTIVRGEIMRTLRDMGEPRVIPDILAMALDEDPLIQTFVPFVVGKLYRPEYFETVLRGVTGELPETRSTAIFSLAIASEKRAIPSARTMLHDPHHTVRIAAESALGLLGDRESIEAIKELADYDPNPQVRDAARVALVVAKIDAPNLLARLIFGLASSVPEVRLNSATLLSAIADKRTVSALRLVLDDDDEIIRNAARAGIKSMLDE